ncbi:MAG: HAD family phosphatase [Gemmatimonadetes bacterium]|nr:HAD family phosphatase [Gemmatimonadota bacterium]
MDGTLWDTEQVSERAISQLLEEWRIDSTQVDLLTFHGIKWTQIEQLLEQQFPSLRGRSTAAAIEARFEELLEVEPAPLIRGARQAFVAAATALPQATAIVTGSNSHAVETFLDLADLRSHCATYNSADMYERSKPDPQSYAMTAAQLGVEPQHCLVFEDSLAGMQAAAAAKMHCIAITAGQAPRIASGQEHADGVITDYTELPEGFFRRVSQKT